MGISFTEARKTWLLETANTSYAMGIDGEGRLIHLYWGSKLQVPDDYPLPVQTGPFSPPGLGEPPGQKILFEGPADLTAEEYAPWGGVRYGEPCLKVTFPDHVRDLILRYDSYAIDDSTGTLTVTLADPHYPIRVYLRYRPREAYDLIERWAEVENLGSDPIHLEQVMSAAWQFPRRGDLRLTHLVGRWGAETQLRRATLTEGKRVLESRRGTTSHHANPWFALDSGDASEQQGEVWFGALAWSGSWKIVVEKNSFGGVRVVGGVQDFDFLYPLAAGERFATPRFVAGYTAGGFGAASRALHRYQLDEVLPPAHRHKLRPVLYNSWEATRFAVNEEGQMALLERAAALGVELFVMDDGWFGQRNNDRAGLGDWNVNPQKFPRGLKPLIDRANELGMEFGLWVEPEMVNPDSELYRQHPDWVYHFPNRPRSEVRNQLVLNLARDDVREFVYGFLHRLLSEHNIRFIKWDMNRPFSEPGWPEASPEEQRSVWVRHVDNLYSVLDRLRAAHPDVLFEACASGGGRVDLGILARTDQVWTSDNTDAFARLSIQEGFSMAYCPKVMVAWVTDTPNALTGRSVPLKYRFHVAMMGTLGLGGNLNRWSDSELDEARELIRLYKAIRPIVQEGQQFRLLSAQDGEVAAVLYVAPDRSEAVLFAFLHAHPLVPLPPVRLHGLDPAALYRVEGLEAPVSGSALLHRGLELPLRGDFDSAVVRIRRV